MTSTVYVNGSTLTDEDWFNDLNRLHYTIFGDPAAAGPLIITLNGAERARYTATGGHQSTWVPRTNLGYSNADTTPSVANTGFMSITNSAPTTITNFDDGESGQVIVLFFNDANTTIDRSNCVLSGGVNFVSTANDILVLYKTNTVWAEMSRGVNN